MILHILGELQNLFLIKNENKHKRMQKYFLLDRVKLENCYTHFVQLNISRDRRVSGRIHSFVKRWSTQACLA